MCGWQKGGTPAIQRSRLNSASQATTSLTFTGFRDAWRKALHCIILAEAFFEPDWRFGKAVPTRIVRADGQPMGIAGLWSSWRSPDGASIYSFSMLTINADDHALMKSFHKPTDEKRMVVILPEDSWLLAKPEHSMEFMLLSPAHY